MSRFLKAHINGVDHWWDGNYWNDDPSERKDVTDREVSRVNRLFANEKSIEPELEIRK